MFTFATTRRIAQTLVASSSLVLLHCLLTTGLSVVATEGHTVPSAVWREEIRALGTLSILTLLWLVFGLLEGVCTPDGDAQRHITSVVVEWGLLSMLHVEWLAHAQSIFTIYATSRNALLLLSAFVTLASVSVLHSALSIKILIELCNVPTAWRDSDFWFADVDQHAWYERTGELQIAGGEEASLAGSEKKALLV